MRLSYSDEEGKISPPEIYSTPQSFDGGIALIRAFVEKVKKEKKFVCCAVGLPGTFNREKSVLFHAPNLKGWEGKPIKEVLTQVCGIEVRLENDAALAALGEAVFGAGRGYEIVGYFTISTGVGGARVVGGKLDRSIFGFEPGHQIIHLGDFVSGKFFELEDLISGIGVRKRYGQSANEIFDSNVWDEVARLTALGIYNSQLHWSCEVIVLGGGLVFHNKIILNKVENYLKSLNKYFFQTPVVKKAELDELSGIYGALIYAK